MGVLILLLTGGQFLLIILFSSTHLIRKKAIIGVIRKFWLHPTGFLLSHISPIDSKPGDSRFVREYGPASMRDKCGGIGFRAFLLRQGLIEYIMNVVTNAYKLLGAVADGNDDSCDT